MRKQEEVKERKDIGNQRRKPQGARRSNSSRRKNPDGAAAANSYENVKIV